MATRKQSWHCLEVRVPQAVSEEIAACCHAAGSCGLQVVEGPEDRLLAYFDASLDRERIAAEMAAQLQRRGLAPDRMGWAEVTEEDWERQWRRFFRPVWATPRIVVHPPWIPVSVEEGQIAIAIEPKMAFGTGTHASTQLTLQALEDLVRPGDRCLDLGTGSGILAIAAARLGAGEVVAVDLDSTALENAAENCRRNRVADQVRLSCGSLEAAGAGPFAVVLANIQSHTLYPLLDPLRRCLAPGGAAVFAGLLATEREGFGDRMEQAGLRVERTCGRQEWIAMVGRSPA